jgi:histidinol dehydrogenase
MTAVVARVAGVGQVVVCVPPNKEGKVAEATLAATEVAGVDVVHPVGGAQAIAAMAYGTESVRKMDVIVGPGNMYVAQAKQQVAGAVAVPSAFTGPSEVVVVADGTAPAEFTATDLVAQAEHGPDGLAWLVTWDEAVADDVDSALEDVVAGSPRRGDIAVTLASNGHCVIVDDEQQALAVVDAIAPEHLQLMVADAEILAERVCNAGAVFLGPWTPTSIGDYVAGPSHVLPTAGTARFAGALTVADFTKDVNWITADQDALRRLGPHVEALAVAEGLEAHAESIRVRRQHG